MPMSYRLQGAVHAAERQTKRRRALGYMIVALTVLGIGYVVWWVVAVGSSRRYRAIEKFRGGAAVEVVAPVPT